MMFVRNKNTSPVNQRKQSFQSRLFSFTGIKFFQSKVANLFQPQSTSPRIKSPHKQISSPAFSVDGNTLNSNILLNKNEKHNKEEITSKRIEITLKICKVRGFNNIGNTCYMNSLLQCLLNLSKFNSALIHQVKTLKNKKYDVVNEYSNLLQFFLDSYSSSPFTPSRIKSSIGKKKTRFLGNAQQDSQQFLTAFLQITNDQMSRITEKPKYIELQNDIRKKSIPNLSDEWWSYSKKRDDSVICDYFQGQLISTVICKKCHHESVTFDNIWGLPISLTKSCYSISEYIRRSWTNDSQVQDYYCSQCKKHRTCTKKILLFRPPQILVVQLKRFEYDSKHKQKIKTSVKLSDSLNLSDWLHPLAPRQSCNYKLSSMVHHYGEVDYGHYTSHVYKQKQRKWYLMNDSKMSENTPDSPNNTVYLLFYERINK